MCHFFLKFLKPYSNHLTQNLNQLTINFQQINAPFKKQLLFLEISYYDSAFELDIWSYDLIRTQCLGLGPDSGLPHLDFGLDLGLTCLYLGLDSRLDWKDLRLTRDLQNSELFPPLVANLN